MNRIWEDLRAANQDRQRKWDTDNVIDLDWRMNELFGEAGEVCNLLKKIDRENAKLPGSRATQAMLGEELADVIICSDLLLMSIGQPEVARARMPTVVHGHLATLGIKIMTHLARAAEYLENREDDLVLSELEEVNWLVTCVAYNFHNPLVTQPLDLPVAVSRKFNKTSHTVGLPVFLDLDGQIRASGKDPMYV